jgi:hypothetical protein
MRQITRSTAMFDFRGYLYLTIFRNTTRNKIPHILQWNMCYKSPTHNFQSIYATLFSENFTFHMDNHGYVQESILFTVCVKRLRFVVI